MTDQTNQTNEAPKIDLDEVKRRQYFSPENLAQGITTLANMQTVFAGKVPFASNLAIDEADGSVNIPENFGLLIQPLMERVQGEKKKVVAFISAAIPSLEAVAADEKGRAYLDSVIQEAIGRKLKQTYNAAIDKRQVPRFPTTLAGFIESAQRQQVMIAFNKAASHMIKALEEKNFTINTEFLKAALQSKEFAETNFGTKINWDKISDSMAAWAKKQGYSTQIFETWKANRDTTKFSLAQDDLNLDDLDLSDDEE